MEATAQRTRSSLQESGKLIHFKSGGNALEKRSWSGILVILYSPGFPHVSPGQGPAVGSPSRTGSEERSGPRVCRTDFRPLSRSRSACPSCESCMQSWHHLAASRQHRPRTLLSPSLYYDDYLGSPPCCSPSHPSQKSIYLSSPFLLLFMATRAIYLSKELLILRVPL